MTQQEIQEYNKKCALFLGFKCSINEQYQLPNMMVFPPAQNSNLCKTAKVCCVEDMQFNISWDWIMEVVEKIQLLDIVHDNTRSYDSVYKTYECTFSPSYKTHDFGHIRGISKTSEKEAVVQAINQFLIFYNENNK